MSTENLFGRVYESIGSSSSDLLLVTKGQLKVKWGNKYIDLIKDGEVNYPKTSVQKLIEETIKQNFPSNIIFLYEGETAPKNWSKIDIDSGIPGYIYIKKQ